MDSKPHTKEHEVGKLAQWAQKEQKVVRPGLVAGFQQLDLSNMLKEDEEAAKEWNAVLQQPNADPARSMIIRIPGPDPALLFSSSFSTDLIPLHSKGACSITKIRGVDETVSTAEIGKGIHVEKSVRVIITPGLELLYLPLR